MKDCLFCKIINNEMDSLTLFENENVKVILDAFPDSPGHTLIIPKKHYKDLDDIPLEVLNEIFAAAKVVKPVLEKNLNPNSIVLVQNNGEKQAIKHYHLHIIPDYKEKNNMNKEDIYSLIKGEF